MEKIVTELEVQKKNPNRINVYLNDEFAFGVSRFVGAWLQEGEKIDEEAIEKLVQKEAREKALQKAFQYINYQPRSTFQVRKKLLDQGFSEPIIDDVILECVQKEYVDDTQFAKDWIDSRSRSKPRSRKMFTFELRKKHIPEEIISQVITLAPEDIEMAQRLAQKYSRRFSHLDNKSFQKKMMGVLARRAFSFSVINKVIDELMLERSTE